MTLKDIFVDDIILPASFDDPKKWRLAPQKRILKNFGNQMLDSSLVELLTEFCNDEMKVNHVEIEHYKKWHNVYWPTTVTSREIENIAFLQIVGRLKTVQQTTKESNSAKSI